MRLFGVNVRSVPFTWNRKRKYSSFAIGRTQRSRFFPLAERYALSRSPYADANTDEVKRRAYRSTSRNGDRSNLLEQKETRRSYEGSQGRRVGLIAR